MILQELNTFTSADGVIKISEVDKELEANFNNLKKRERRNYSADEIRLLPFASPKNPHKEEWNLRAKSFMRFRTHLSRKRGLLQILDLGCGNGWFSAQLEKNFKHQYYCVDINLPELLLGAKIFNSENLKFILADIFEISFPRSSFDLIIFNSSIQYFKDLRILMREMFYLLKNDGEIHIIDSPIYYRSELDYEKTRSVNYYNTLGLPEMNENLFHHTYESLTDYRHQIHFNPKSITNRIFNFAFSKDSPFPWIMITR
jgi:ubiquinone/menaquinone biosynthesis C-methylase UbiE